MKVRLHWQAWTLAALLCCTSSGVVLGTPYGNRFLFAQKLALLACPLFAIGGLARLAAMARAATRSAPTILLAEEEKEEGELLSSHGMRHFVTESVGRWPGRAGIGLFVSRISRDQGLRLIDSTPRRFRPSARTTVTVLRPFRTVGEPVGRLVVRARVLAVEQTERDADMSSQQLGMKAISGLVGIVVLFISTVICITVVARTSGQMVGVAALGVLLAFRSWIKFRRYYTQMSRLRMRPRIPEDLIREPCVLYLRPHPPDPVPGSPWEGSLDDDLHTILAGTAMFRVGYVPAVPPAAGVALLPLPADDWKAALTTALPQCGLVVIPAVGTSPETLWQFAEAVRLVPPSLLLLLLPSGENADEEYGCFRQAAANAFEERRVSLPGADQAKFHFPSLPDKLSDVSQPGLHEPALRGVIQFNDDWTPAVIRFNVDDAETSRRARLQRIREELQPTLSRPSRMQE